MSISDDKREQILALVRDGWTDSATAKQVGVSFPTVKRYREAAGLARGTRRVNSVCEDLSTILDMARAGWSDGAIVKLVGASRATVRRARESGGVPRGNRRTAGPSRIDVGRRERRREQLQRYADEGLSLAEAGALMGLTRERVRQLYRDLGIERERVPTHHRKAPATNRALRLIEEVGGCVPDADIASAAGVCSATVYQLRKAANIEAYSGHNAETMADRNLAAYFDVWRGVSMRDVASRHRFSSPAVAASTIHAFCRRHNLPKPARRRFGGREGLRPGRLIDIGGMPPKVDP